VTVHVVQLDSGLKVHSSAADLLKTTAKQWLQSILNTVQDEVTPPGTRPWLVPSARFLVWR